MKHLEGLQLLAALIDAIKDDAELVLVRVLQHGGRNAHGIKDIECLHIPSAQRLDFSTLFEPLPGALKVEEEIEGHH